MSDEMHIIVQGEHKLVMVDSQLLIELLKKAEVFEQAKLQGVPEMYAEMRAHTQKALDRVNIVRK